MKKENGVTLIVVVIMIILMAILIGATVDYGVNSIRTVKFQNYQYELEQIQGKVDTIYEKIKLGNDEYLNLGKSVTASSEAMATLQKVKGSVGAENYRYLTQKEVQDNLDITSEPGDVIINFMTREVISVKGFEYNGRLYYTLSDMK